jgi:predicted small integral membrane protein
MICILQRVVFSTREMEMSYHRIKIIGSLVGALLLAGGFALYAQAQVVDPCSYGCPKDGCPKCDTGGPIKK